MNSTHAFSGRWCFNFIYSPAILNLNLPVDKNRRDISQYPLNKVLFHSKHLLNIWKPILVMNQYLRLLIKLYLFHTSFKVAVSISDCRQRLGLFETLLNFSFSMEKQIQFFEWKYTSDIVAYHECWTDKNE